MKEIKMAAVSPETYAECVKNIVMPAIGNMNWPDVECSCEESSEECNAACIEALACHLTFRLTQNSKIISMVGEHDLDEFLTTIENRSLGECGVCCICGGHYVLYGNNPAPVFTDEDDRCCDYCNRAVVIPARMKLIMESQTPKRKSHSRTAS